MNCLFALLTFGGLVALSGSLASAVTLPNSNSVTVAWEPSPSPQTVGYHVYVGRASKTYTNVLDAGLATNITIPNLVPGVTYFLAATAYDVAGLESDYSNEIAYTAPGSGPRLQLGPVSSQAVSMTGSGVAAAVYEVLTTQDFTSWSVIGNVTADSNGVFQFSAPAAAQHQSFYRVRQTAP